MKRFLASILALALLTTQASATATVTITITSALGTVPTVVNTFTDAEAAKIAAYVISLRKGAIVQTPAVAAVPAVLDGQGNVVTPAVPAQPAVMRDPTAIEALGLYFKDWISDLAAKVTATARSTAAQTASDAVTPVTPK